MISSFYQRGYSILGVLGTSGGKAFLGTRKKFGDVKRTKIRPSTYQVPGTVLSALLYWFINCHDNPIRWALASLPFYRWGNGGSERRSNLLKDPSRLRGIKISLAVHPMNGPSFFPGLQGRLSYPFPEYHSDPQHSFPPLKSLFLGSPSLLPRVPQWSPVGSLCLGFPAPLIFPVSWARLTRIKCPCP